MNEQDIRADSLDHNCTSLGNSEKVEGRGSQLLDRPSILARFVPEKVVPALVS